MPVQRFNPFKNMNSIPTLSGSHRRTYKTIFQHPVSHNLEWRAVYGLLEKLGSVVEDANGNLKATRNGHTLVLNPPRAKDVAEADEVMILRNFLEQSAVAVPPAETQPTETDMHFLLVIDHHEARIFRSEMHGAVPMQILPHKPEDFFRHAQDSKDFSSGQEKPDPNSFFEPVAKALQAAKQLLVFGTGTGTSSEMDQFIEWLKHNHADLAKRVIGAVVVDEHHLSVEQLLAKARDFYATPRKPLA